MILNTVLIVLLCVLVFLIWIAWTGTKGAPWIPTPKKNVHSMLELAEVGSSDIVYDLGSGDGRILIMAAKEFGAKSVGIELDPIRVIWSRFKIRRARIANNARVIKGNLFEINLQDATVVTIYQTLGVNKRLREKLRSELKPGARIVTYRLIIDGLNLSKRDEEGSAYLYII